MLRALLLLLIATVSFAQMSKEEKKEGFKPLLKGNSLKAWDGDPRLWKLSNGVLTGSTDGVTLQGNTFLIYKKREFSDFVLRTQVKLRNHNSGIQFRSEALPNWVVKGLQADMAEGNWWGSIYDEKGKRGVIVNGWKGKGERLVKPTDWNDVEVSAIGAKITVKLNGEVTAELTDDSKLSGILALQLHRGPGMQVEFRNMRLRALK
jgi:hypothetical protein